MDRCTAPSPEKPLEVGTRPRSGRISASVEKDNADIIDTRCIVRTAGERSNATAFENTGWGAVNVRAARTWAAGLETKIVKLIADRIVTESAKTPLILMRNSSGAELRSGRLGIFVWWTYAWDNQGITHEFCS